MLIVLLDQPGVCVYASAAEAERDIEAIDAESEIRAAFYESAVPYRVDWLRPNQRGTFSVTPGAYRSVPDGMADPEGLVSVLEQHLERAQPPETIEMLRDLLARWTSRSPHALRSDRWRCQF